MLLSFPWAGATSAGAWDALGADAELLGAGLRLHAAVASKENWQERDRKCFECGVVNHTSS